MRPDLGPGPAIGCVVDGQHRLVRLSRCTSAAGGQLVAGHPGRRPVDRAGLGRPQHHLTAPSRTALWKGLWSLEGRVMARWKGALVALLTVGLTGLGTVAAEGAAAGSGSHGQGASLVVHTDAGAVRGVRADGV